MKVIVSILTISSLLVLGTANASYNDPPKDPKCVNQCNVKYTEEYLKCHAVSQCESYVQYAVSNCIHECADAK